MSGLTDLASWIGNWAECHRGFGLQDKHPSRKDCEWCTAARDPREVFCRIWSSENGTTASDLPSPRRAAPGATAQSICEMPSLILFEYSWGLFRLGCSATAPAVLPFRHGGTTNSVTPVI